MTSNLYWMAGPWPGRLAIAARPRGWDWLDDEVNGWRRAGVAVIVSLLEEDEAAELGLAEESAAAESAGVRFLSFPIPDRGIPASRQAAGSLIVAITDALEHGQNVAVHCRQGLGRSGLISAAVLAASGLDPDRAIEVVTATRGQNVPETAEQRRWIERLPSEPPTVAPRR